MSLETFSAIGICLVVTFVKRSQTDCLHLLFHLSTYCLAWQSWCALTGWTHQMPVNRMMKAREGMMGGEGEKVDDRECTGKKLLFTCCVCVCVCVQTYTKTVVKMLVLCPYDHLQTVFRLTFCWEMHACCGTNRQDSETEDPVTQQPHLTHTWEAFISSEAGLTRSHGRQVRREKLAPLSCVATASSIMSIITGIQILLELFRPSGLCPNDKH